MNKPRVTGIVGIWAIRAVWGIGSASVNLQQLGLLGSSGTTLQIELVTTLQRTYYFVIALNVLSLIAIAMTLSYRRIGLMVGGSVTIVDFLGLSWFLINGTTNKFNIVMLIIDMLILYYIYRFLTHEPERLAFK